MAIPYFTEITTSTTAGSTDMPDGFKLGAIVNLDGTNNCVVSVTEAIDTGSAGQATLTPTNDTISYEAINEGMEVSTIYHDAAAGTPILRITGYIS